MPGINCVYPDERVTYEDPQTGRTVTQLTSAANNAKAYFTAPHFVDNGQTLVFCSDRTGTWEIFKMDLLDGKIVQLTEDADLTGFNSRISLCCHPMKPLAYVMGGANERLLVVDVERGGSEEMARVPENCFGDLIVISADGSYIASSYIEDFYNRPNQLMSRRPGEIYGGAAEYRFRKPRSVVYTMDTANGDVDAIWGDNEYLDHVQIPQKDPSRIIFCHGCGNTPQRMWIVDREDLPGKQPQPLVSEHPTLEAVGHEFACADGWIGYQYATYEGGYRQNRTDYFSFVDPVTHEVENYQLPGPRPGHFQVNQDRSLAIADGDSPAGQVEDWVSPYIRMMARYELKDDRATPTVLCSHDSSFKTHESHPHPVLTPDGQHAIFASDRGGATHLYITRFVD